MPGKPPPNTIRQWIEYWWLIMANPTFRQARDRRRAYYEHRLAKSIHRPWR